MKRVILIAVSVMHIVMHAGCFPEGTPVWIIANNVCQNLVTIESKIDALALCGLQAVDQSGLLISTPGSYCLMQDVVGTVTIASSYVDLNLNGHSINNGLNGVLVQSGLHDVSVSNGVIQDSLEEGILVQEGCARIALKDVTVLNVAQNTDRYAIDFVGTTVDRITACEVSGVTVSRAPNGVRVLNGDNNSINHVNVNTLLNSNDATGVALQGDPTQAASGNILAECFIFSVSSDAASAQGVASTYTQNTTVSGLTISTVIGNVNAFGYASTVGIGNEYRDCNVSDVHTFGNGFLGAIGYYLSSEQNYSVLNSRAVNLLTTGQIVAGFAFLTSVHALIDSCVVSEVSAVNPTTAAFAFLVATFSDPSTDIQLNNLTAQNIGLGTAGLASGVSVFSNSFDISVSGCRMQNISAMGQTFGIALNNVTGAYMTDCSCSGMSDTNYAVAYALIGAKCATIRRCLGKGITSSGLNAAGFNIVTSSDCSFEGCSSSCVSGTSAAVNGFYIQNSSVLALSNCDATYNENQGSVDQVAGFEVQNSSDILFNGCFTQGNVADGGFGGIGHGFYINRSSQVQMLDCVSVQNNDSAFYVDEFSNACLVRNSVGANSGQGFADFAMTSTFVENLAGINGAVPSVLNNYFGIPTNIIAVPGAMPVVGVNISA